MPPTDAAATQDRVVLERRFDAPVQLVWAMWTDPRHFAAWYGPPGATVAVVEMDVRVGGRRLVRMAVETPAGAREMWFAGEFREVVENERLVYTDAVSDEGGRLGAPDPAATEVRVEFEALGAATRMVLTHIGVPAGSAGAAGWAGALGKLAALLAAPR